MIKAQLSLVAVPRAPSRRKGRLWLLGGSTAALLLLVVGFYFVSTYWPYRYRQVKPLLEDVLASQVAVAQYHRTYFPHPGFVAIGLTLRRKSAPDLPPVGTAERLIVQGSWLDLLTLRERVRLVDITGLHIVIPPPGSRASHEDFPPGSSADFSGPETLIERLDMHHAVLEIQRTGGGSYSFPIHELHLRNVHKGQAAPYDVDMQNPQPGGHIQATGSFGPLNPNDLASTPLSGDFTFSSVALHDLGKVSGTLSSKGHFDGLLAAIHASAASNTPDFAVSSGKPTPVTGQVRCTINGLNGDVNLESIDARIGSSTVHATGAVGGNPKVTNLDLTVANGRLQDVMRPFVHDQVPVTGVVWLRSHAYLAPSGKGSGFLQRLQVDGTFDVPSERLTSRTSEQTLSAFSERAQGTQAPVPDPLSVHPGDAPAATDVLSSLKGAARIRNGIVSTQQVTFGIPGAQATLHGTFSLHEESVHLNGDLKMEAGISHVTTGFKSALLKPLTPFFKKRNAGAVLPIAVTGTPGQYKVSQDVIP